MSRNVKDPLDTNCTTFRTRFPEWLVTWFVHFLAMNKTKIPIFTNAVRMWLVTCDMKNWKVENFRLQTRSNSVIFQWRNVLGCRKSKRHIETEAIMLGPRWHGIRESSVKWTTRYGTDINLTYVRYRRILRTWVESRQLCQWGRHSSTLQGLLRFVKDVQSFVSPPTYAMRLGLTHDS